MQRMAVVPPGHTQDCDLVGIMSSKLLNPLASAFQMMLAGFQACGLSAYLEGLQHSTGNRAMDVQLIINFCKGRRNANWLALGHKCHMTRQALRQDLVNFCLVIYRAMLISASSTML